MDGVSVAASIVGIATAGVQISIKLVTLATQISTASDRVSSIGNDISLTSGVLHQLGELMTQKTTGDGISILNQDGLETTRTFAAMCERIFKEVEMEVKKASEQLRNYKPGQGRMRGEKIKLSINERAKWPFLQPKIDILRADLRDAKSTLMLVLQVASLALSKRMADISISTTEHQDFVRAIVALELQRREERKDSTEQQAVSKSSGSNDKSNVWNADKIPPGEGTLKLDWKPQPSSSLAQAARKHTAEVKKSLKDSSDRQVRSLADPIVNYGVGQSRGLETESFMNLSLATSPGSNFRGTDGNSNVPKNHAIVSPHILLSSDSDSGTQTNHSTDLQLFLLKPIVKDLFDRIELRWSVQNTDLQPLAIREHMAKNEKHDLPSVVEMLQQLHAYEQAMVDSETSKDSGGSVVSLTRTKTDIRSRDMLFTGVPGLQFVVQRQIHQSPVWTPSHHMRSPQPHPSGPPANKALGPQEEASGSMATSEGNTNSPASELLKMTALMARKRTKTGCLTCRKRRIRCGEERPTCEVCVKSKRECEGYISRVIFKNPLGAFRSTQQGTAHTLNSSRSHEAADIYEGMSSASVDTLIAPRLLSFTELTGLEQLHVADGSIAAENSHGRTSYTVNEDYEHKKRWMEPRTPPPPPPPPQPVSIPDDEKDIAFEACEQDQEDEEASAMVTGLLGKYTTLFDV